MVDFTLKAYQLLLESFLDNGFLFKTIEGYLESPTNKVVILRHDVDRSPENALRISKIEDRLKIKGSYHFRIIAESNRSEVIRMIASNGHEIAYHYEDLSLQARKLNLRSNEVSASLADQAFKAFKANLHYFRQYYPVRVISMHGSPISKVDNRYLWKYFDYKSLGVVAEPYFDLSLDDMLYLTDTGRRWDGSNVAIRDKTVCRDTEYYVDWIRKPKKGSALAMTEKGHDLQKKLRLRRTEDLIAAIESRQIAEKVLLTVHPQRWSKTFSGWVIELLAQSLKNPIKYLINWSLPGSTEVKSS